MSIFDNLAYFYTKRERQRKSRSLFAAAKKKQLKVSPKDKSWGGIRASLPFCVYMCLFCCDLHYFNPFTVQIILHPAQEHKQMQKRPKIMSMTQKLRLKPKPKKVFEVFLFSKIRNKRFCFSAFFLCFSPNYLSEHV